MSIGREKIYSAFFACLATQADQSNPAAIDAMQSVGLTPLPKVASPLFRYADRRIAPVGTLPLSFYPAIMIKTMGEVFDRELVHGPAKTTLVCHVYVQSAIGQDANAIPDVDMNNLADAVTDLIETGAGRFLEGYNLLDVDPDVPGGLVFACWVTGRANNYIAIKEQVYSEQLFEVSILTPH